MEHPTPHRLHQLVAATNNKHKLSEIKPLLEPAFRILSLDEIGCTEELSETADTLEGNSLQKAMYIFNAFKLPCFADDTGLEVPSLNGEPGVYSARYAGEHKSSADNILLLLKNLENKSNREARFRTIITLVQLDGSIKTFEGIVNGEIVHSGRGTDGFGYDPVFLPHGYTRTFAEMTVEEKNMFSHRALAIQKLVSFLRP